MNDFCLTFNFCSLLSDSILNSVTPPNNQFSCQDLTNLNCYNLAWPRYWWVTMKILFLPSKHQMTLVDPSTFWYCCTLYITNSAQWYFGMKLVKKNHDFFVFKHCNSYKRICKRLKRFLLWFRCAKTQDLALQMGWFCFQFWTILHNLALIYTLCYVPKIGESIG